MSSTDRRPLGAVRSFAANAALVVVSSAVTALLLCALGEAALRWKYGALPTQAQLSMNMADARRGWVMRPGSYSYFDVRALRRVDVTVNELGVRNPPLAPQPAPGVQRVTVLGDSFIFGAPLEADATITSRLQALAGSAYEIVNVGVPGYGTGQEYLLLEDLRAKGYRVGNKLVLAFFTNDIQDNLGLDYDSLERNPLQPVFHVDAEGALQQLPGGRPNAAPRRGMRLLGDSLFISFVRYQLEVLAVSNPRIVAALETLHLAPQLPRTPGVIAGWYGPQWEARWQVTADVLEYLVAKVRRMPDPPEVYIMFVPSPFQVHQSFQRVLAAAAARDERSASFLSDPDRPQRLLQAQAERLHVPFIDLTPALRRAAEGSALYFPREGHFNEAGAAIAAQVLYERVIGSGR